MFQAFQVKNFRCFRHLKLDSLERVNLVTGKNNAGKTALLEAIFLHLGAINPELSTLRLNAFRGFEVPLAEALETWGWLFRDRETGGEIESTSTDEHGVKRRLVIRLGVAETSEVPLAEKGHRGGGGSSHALVSRPVPQELRLEFDDGSGHVVRSSSVIAEDHVEFRAPASAAFPLSCFFSTRLRSKDEDVDRFSKLDEVGRQDELLAILKLVEPKLQRLAVHTVRGVTSIRGDVGMGRMVPLALMGEGLVRLLSISTAILSCKDGAVLVDEIENGLHHEVLPSVWAGVAEAARKSNVQVFATTHSRECVEAAHRAFSESLHYDLRVIRLEREEKEICAIPYTKDTLDTSFEMSLEVR